MAQNQFDRMSKMKITSMARCDIGHSPFWDPAVDEPPCLNQPTFRWRVDEFVPGHWNYRCNQHVRWLDPTILGMVIEPYEEDKA